MQETFDLEEQLSDEDTVELAKLGDDYKITWKCGGAVAQERQSISGNGKVVSIDGQRCFQRVTPYEGIADMAENDDNATVEVITNE